MGDSEEIFGAFVSHSCPHCVRFTNDYKKEIKSGEIKLLPVDDKKGNPTEWMDVAAKNGVRGVPQLIKFKKNGKVVSADSIEVSGKCDLEEYKKTGECKGGYPFE